MLKLVEAGSEKARGRTNNRVVVGRGRDVRESVNAVTQLNEEAAPCIR